MEERLGLLWNTSFGSMILHGTFYNNKDLFSVYTALSDNMGGHLWANKLLIICTGIKVILFYI